MLMRIIRSIKLIIFNYDGRKKIYTEYDSFDNNYVVGCFCKDLISITSNETAMSIKIEQVITVQKISI